MWLVIILVFYEIVKVFIQNCQSMAIFGKAFTLKIVEICQTEISIKQTEKSYAVSSD